MHKKGSITTLLVVALLALGVMAFVSFESDTTGAVSARSVALQSSYAIPKQPQTTGSDLAQVQLQCYIWKYDHPNVQAPVEIAGLCASFGVTV